MITGEYGAGKTLLSLKLVEHLRAIGDQPFAYISTPMQSYREVLRQICSALELGVVDEHSDEETLHHRIYRHFEGNQNSTLIVILDDTQEYDARQLNQIRLLSTFSHEGFFPIRLFLFANTAFIQRLHSSDLKPLDQRIKRRHRLKNFDFEETKEYIYFQLIEAGASGSPVFPDESIHRIVELTEGTPRRINNICDMCLLTGSILGADIIDLAIVEEAASDLGWAVSPKPEKNSDSPMRAIVLPAPVNAHAPETAVITAPIAEAPETTWAQQADLCLGGAETTADTDYYIWAWRLVVVLAITAILVVTIPM